MEAQGNSCLDYFDMAESLPLRNRGVGPAQAAQQNIANGLF